MKTKESKPSYEDLQKQLASLQSERTQEKNRVKKSRTVTLSVAQWEALESKAKQVGQSVNGTIADFANDLLGF